MPEFRSCQSAPEMSVGAGARRWECAIADGFPIAVLVWLAAFIGRLPSQSWPSQVLLGVILCTLALGAFAVGLRRGSVMQAGGALLVTGLINSLLVASVIGAQKPPGNAPRLDMAIFLWMPGNLALSVVIGTVFGFLGKLVRPRGAAPTVVRDTSATQAQQGWTIALTTIILIAMGGMVTTMGAGLSVPDWPTSYGYNMFFFPFTKMVGGIFYEHSHRLVGSLVGLETLVLCAWLWITLWRDGIDKARRRLALVGSAALLLVVAQGLLGAARVVTVNHGGNEPAQAFAVVHAITAPCFLLVVLYLVALLQGRRAEPADEALLIASSSPARGLIRKLALIGVVLVLVQTVLGAVTRHFHYDWSLLLHVLNAIAVSFVGLGLATLLLIHSDLKRTQTIGFGIMGVLAAQLFLGGTAWFITARMDAVDQTTSRAATLSVTGHVVLGAVLLGLVWWTLLHVGRNARAQVAKQNRPGRAAGAPGRAVEGAAA